MRVAFIGRDHRFSTAVLDALRPEHELVALVESASRGPAPSPARRLLRAAKARVAGPPGLARTAGELDVPHLLLDRGQRDALPEFLRAARPDVVCVASLTQLLSAEVLAIPGHGAINLHPSRLPEYHGPFPWFWQYHDFRLDIGVTVHQLDTGQDTGPILEQRPVSLDLGMDIADATERVAPIGAAAMAAAVRALEDGTAAPRPQPAHDHPKARIVGRDERFVDWDTWPLERVFHFMRGTYLWVDVVDGIGERRAAGMEPGDPGARPGTIATDAAGTYLAHRCGRIRLT